MGFFSSFKKAMPSAPVSDWTKEDVSLWAKARGLPKNCRTALAGVNGKRLLQMQESELHALFVSKPDPESLQVIVSAVNSLKAQAQTTPQNGQLAPPVPQNKQPPARIQFQAPVLPSEQRPLAALPAYQNPPQQYTLQEQLHQQQHRRVWEEHQHAQIGHDEEVLSPAMQQQRAWEQQQALAHPELSKGFSATTGGESYQQQEGAFSPASNSLSTPPVQPNSYQSYTPRTASSSAMHSPQIAVAEAAPPAPAPVPLAAPDAIASQPSPHAVSASPQSSMQASPYAPAANTRDGVLPSAYSASGADTGRTSPYVVLPSPRDTSSATAEASPLISPLASSHARPVLGAKKYTGPQSLRDHADFLCKFMDTKVTVTEVAEFLQPLERTKGLVELCQANPTAGSLFAAIYHTYNDCFDAICCIQNASRLQDFCLDLVCLLEMAGKKGIEVPETLCMEIIVVLKQGSDLVATFSSAGWLLHMAFMQDIKGRFDAVHNQIVRKLQAANLDILVQNKPLLMGDYKDPSRSLRRVLKQLGKGSIADGIYEVIANNTNRAKIAAVLEVNDSALAEELGNFPQGDQSVDLAMLYDNLIAGKVATKMNDADLIDHEKIFDWYDSGRKGYMDMSDLKAVLLDLGMLESVKDKDQFVATQMSMADKDQTKSLSLQEFSNYYSSLVFSGERHQLRTKMGIEAENELKHQFLAFANYGIRSEVVSDMDGKTFAKYSQDCKLIDRHLLNTDVDIIFCKVKAKGARRIDFDRFLHALSLIAEKKRCSFVDIITHCLKYDGPVTHATKAENTRLHDDKSTYTGVYARGGPTNVERNMDLANITDRSRADARGVKLPPAPRLWNAPALRRATTDGSQTHRRASTGATPFGSLHGSSISHPGERRSTPGPHSADRALRTPRNMEAETPRRPPVYEGLDEVQNTFVSFAMFGKRTTEEEFNVRHVKIDSAAFAKLCKESGIMDAKLNITRVDLVFTKFSDHKTKRMSYKQFSTAIPALAQAKGVEPARISKAFAECPGPLLKGTIAPTVKWHDDKNTYTGVYARGGPTNVDKKMKLEDMVDRSAEEHRQFRRQSFGPRDFALSYR